MFPQEIIDLLEKQQDRVYLLHGPVGPRQDVPTEAQMRVVRFSNTINALIQRDHLRREYSTDLFMPRRQQLI